MYTTGQAVERLDLVSTLANTVKIIRQYRAESTLTVGL